MLPNTNQKYRLTDMLCLVGIAAAVLIFYWQTLGLQTGFYSGDHRQQHYPWAFFYWEQLRQGMLPWWTSYFQAGFPLLAEGQVGALYPLNFLFYRLFAFDFAYTYNILFHFILGGLFFYFLARRFSLSPISALLGTIIYLFGTAQGGYYYNIISLKTLIWFPLTLYLILNIFERRYLSLFWLALVFAMEWTAGYLQYAVYAVFFAGLSAFWFASESWIKGSKDLFFRGLTACAAAVILSVIAALPQLGATFELAQFSNRFGFPSEFAFIGSVNPLAAATLFFPHWDGFLRAELYVGAAGLLFLILALHRPVLRGQVYFTSGFIFSLLLALGKFNPVYKWAVESLHLTSLRVPAKFLYFAGFYAAFLCAYGAEMWLRGDERRKQAMIMWGGLLTAGCAGLIAAHFTLLAFRGPALEKLSAYVAKHYSDSVIHPHSPQYYQDKLTSFYDSVIQSTAPLDFQNFIFICVMTVSLAAVLAAWKLRLNARRFLLICTFLLLGNLWLYADTSVRGNYEDRTFLKPETPVTAFLEHQQDTGRLHRAFRDLEGADSLPLMPSNTMLFHRAVTGAYSPLIMKDYLDVVKGLGDVNDSNSLSVSDKKQFLAHASLLDFLNAEWILSDHAFTFDRFQKAADDGKSFLYRNPHALPRAYFISRTIGLSRNLFLQKLRGGELDFSKIAVLEPQAGITIQPGSEGIQPAYDVQDKQNSLTLKVESTEPGYLVISDVTYPGWKAWVNGKNAKIFRVNGVFRALRLDQPGLWDIEFKYEPLWKRLAPFSLLTAVILLIVPLIFRTKTYAK